MSIQPRDLAKSFFDAVLAASYIGDEALRERVMNELVETNKLLRLNSRPEKNLEQDMADTVAPVVRGSAIRRQLDA